jgi:cytochrome c oxidase assembly factor CtaG
LKPAGWLFVGCLPSVVLAHSGDLGAPVWADAPLWMAQALWLLGAASYGLGAWRRPPARGPLLAFGAAWVLGAFTLFGPLDNWADRSTAWHMVQHMLLIIGVAPLAVLARPLPQWRAALGPRLDAAWRALHAFSRRPLACALLHAGVLWAWHAPVPYQLALAQPLWHVLAHASFLLSAWLFWWAVLRPGQGGVLGAAGALLFTLTHTGLLGALLTFAPEPLYLAESDSLRDQQLAGLVMWIPGGLIYLGVAVWAAWRWLGGLQARDHVA